MDFVPVHFAVDAYGLKEFDGTALYEYPHRDVGESEWGSYNFIHSRREVACFLQSAANYWLKEYHFDGLRMDAVSRMKSIWALDHTYDGFKWVDCKTNNKCVFGYTRTDGKQTLLAFFNFSYMETAIAPEVEGSATMILHTDWETFGGNKRRSMKKSIENQLPPYCGILYAVK